eukprot:GFUD01071490.1.p1 GENE.GFUD01071490.1~~GFUD01071490.1.p1  ORF type:complete len:372 (+),score=93.14 GFUD01071490.1:52-1167(+)
MAYRVVPESNKPVTCTYHQKLAWRITEEVWSKEEMLLLDLETEIPGSYKWVKVRNGGGILMGKMVGGCREVVFATSWPIDVKSDNIDINAVFSLKSVDEETFVSIEGGEGHKNWRFKAVKTKIPNPNYYEIHNTKKFSVDPTRLFGESKCFIFKAELLVNMKDTPSKQSHSLKKPNSFVKDIQTIHHDDDNCDVVIICNGKKFRCHKNILSARSKIFKNMLVNDTLERKTGIIHVKTIPPEAVEEMLKYIYTGEIPDDPEILSDDLLHAADMYQLASLKAACVENLLASLDVLSCISTFILMDRFLPRDVMVREKVTTFMKCKGEEVIETDEWEKLVVSYPTLVTELTRAMLRGSKEDSKHKCQFCVVSYL